MLDEIKKFEDATKEAIKALREYGFEDESLFPTLKLKLYEIFRREGITTEG